MYASVERLDEEREKTLELVYKDMKQVDEGWRWKEAVQNYDEVMLSTAQDTTSYRRALSQNTKTIRKIDTKRDLINKPDLAFINKY